MSPGDGPVIVGTIPTYVALPAGTVDRVVRLGYQTYRHIMERRLSQGDEQVALIERLLEMPGAVVSDAGVTLAA